MGGYKLANAAPIPDAANAGAGRQALARRNTCGEGADRSACRVGCRSQIINVRFFPEMFYMTNRTLGLTWNVKPHSMSAVVLPITSLIIFTAEGHFTS